MRHMPAPKLPEKRWSIDLEKSIQEAHYADEEAYSGRYAFNPNSGKEFFVIDTPPLPVRHMAHRCCVLSTP